MMIYPYAAYDMIEERDKALAAANAIIAQQADELKQISDQRDRLLEGRENALAALGMHPDSDSVDLAAEIRRIRDEGRDEFHELAKLGEELRRLRKQDI